jgi:hypothetical protein
VLTIHFHVLSTYYCRAVSNLEQVHIFAIWQKLPEQPLQAGYFMGFKSKK